MKDNKMDFRSRYGLYVIVGVAAVVVIVLVIWLAGRGRKSAEVQNTDAGVSGIIVNEVSESYTYDFSSVGLQKDAYPEINELAKTYLEALRTGDVETLNKIIQSETKLTEGTVNATGDYVEEYRNISCYSMDGLEDNTYVVYVVFDEKLVGIETPAPSMIRLYVCRDADSNGVYIYNGALTGELKTYMEMADSNEDVSILKAEVNQAFLKACENDAELAELYSRLQQTAANGEAASSTEETAAQSVSETEQTETETSETELSPEETASERASFGSE